MKSSTSTVEDASGPARNLAGATLTRAGWGVTTCYLSREQSYVFPLVSISSTVLQLLSRTSRKPSLCLPYCSMVPVIPCHHDSVFLRPGYPRHLQVSSRQARRKLPQNLWRVAHRKLDQLDSAETLSDLRVPPGNHLEALHGDRRQHGRP
ncbi:MAG: type II toxin-antitoxin system RelE/ParE family toxin [Rhodothermales bacterium]